MKKKINKKERKDSQGKFIRVSIFLKVSYINMHILLFMFWLQLLTFVFHLEVRIKISRPFYFENITKIDYKKPTKFEK